jgi:hypothetical protein
MKTITFKESQNLLKTNICKNGNGTECFVSIFISDEVNKVIISWNNTFREFLIEDNTLVNFSGNSITIIDNFHVSHTFYLFKLIPVTI